MPICCWFSKSCFPCICCPTALYAELAREGWPPSPSHAQRCVYIKPLYSPSSSSCYRNCGCFCPHLNPRTVLHSHDNDSVRHSSDRYSTGARGWQIDVRDRDREPIACAMAPEPSVGKVFIVSIGLGNPHSPIWPWRGGGDSE